MSLGRRILREYAQSKGKEATSFKEIIDGEWGSSDTLITTNSEHIPEHTTLDYKDLYHWLVKKKKLV